MENSVFGNRVKKLRLDNGYSMQDLANKINVTKSSINMWENGGSIPKTIQCVNRLPIRK